jgi:SAM-dependent methyltransferase
MQFGCGHCAPVGWLNFDASLTLRLERVPLLGRFVQRNDAHFPANVHYGDIVKGLPLPPESCQAVYCSHVLEHLALEDLDLALRNTASYLQPGGIFRCVLPDLEKRIRDYVSDSSPTAAIRFMEDTLLGVKTRPGWTGLLGSFLGNSAHLWMWDFKALKSRLESHGFREVRRADYHDSLDPRFAEVEDAARFTNALAIECRK